MADPPKKRSAAVSAIELIAPETNAVMFQLPVGNQMRFDPGQFVTFYVPKDSVTITRSYSIASTADWTDHFELCIKRVEGGYVSSYLSERKVGDPLNLIGPLGRFLLRDPDGRTVIFACTGTGIAPFIPMHESLLRKNPDQSAWLFFGTRFRSGLLYHQRLENAARTHPNFHYVPVCSRPEEGWTGAVGHIQEPLRTTFPDLSLADLYVCGLPNMIQDVQDLATELGCPKDHIFVERY